MMDDFLTAVLNSMSTQLCVVDKTGEILAVNRAWERFALDNGANTLVGTGVGANYLEICEKANGLFCDGAQEVADGLRAVLDSRLVEFAYEYPCPSPVQQRWFMVKISGIKAPLRGAVILHIDITGPRLEEKAREAAANGFAASPVKTGRQDLRAEALLTGILDLGRHLVASHSAALTEWNEDGSMLQVTLADGHWGKFNGLQFIPSQDCACRQAMETGQPVFRSPQDHPDPPPGGIHAAPPFLRGEDACVCLPVLLGEGDAGCVWLVSQTGWSASLQETLLAFGSLASGAIRAIKLQEEASAHVGYLNALRVVDRSILAENALPELLACIVRQGMEQLSMTAGDVIVFSPAGKMKLVAAEGYHRRETPLPVSLLEELCLRLNSEPELSYCLPDADRDSYLRQRGLRRERFHFACTAPVHGCGRLLALLEFYDHDRRELSSGERSFLDALAGQTALGLLHHGLIDSLEGKSRELEEAYEKTITGWSRTLDLRDDITEGHSRRVTELAVELARRLGIQDSELVHIRRGALLHDIGKTGIPDQVLLKPGPLTLEEQRIMNNHPVYAYELLAPIAFLGPALDIPYCHHELWDGSGYPRRLHGEEIPLYARIFTVVDVYDSLVSTRHYRQALAPEQALEYIACQSGKKFDPRITQVFLEMMRAQTAAPRTA